MPTERMADRAKIRELLLRSRTDADSHIDKIRAADPLTYDTLHEELYDYVLAKFLLEPSDKPEDDNFNALAELSLAKSQKVSPELVEEFDTAQSCDGATSSMAKKVLLYMAIQKALNIELPAAESARVKTMQDLSRMVWNTLTAAEEWRGRMEIK